MVRRSEAEATPGVRVAPRPRCLNCVVAQRLIASVRRLHDLQSGGAYRDLGRARGRCPRGSFGGQGFASCHVTAGSDPADLISLAEKFLDGTVPVPGGRAARAAAVVSRQALEQVVAGRCDELVSGLEWPSMRSRHWVC